MRRTGLLVRFAVGLLLGTSALAEPPKLVRSEPASGATDVAVDVGVVRLVFDRDMRTDSFTCWKSPEGEFPPTRKDVESRWADARTFELRIERLKAGTEYFIQLNSDQRQGFRAVGDEALAVTTVHFKTAAEKSAPRQDIYEPGAERSASAPASGPAATTRPAEGTYPLRWNAKVNQVCKVKLTTKVKLDLTIAAEGESEPQHLDSVTEAEYTDTFLAVEQGVPTRLLRHIERVEISMKDPDTGQTQREHAPYEGLEIELGAQPAGSFELLGVKKGEREVAEELAKECSWFTLEPEQPVRVGEAWRMGGARLARVLSALESHEGEVELRLVKVAKDPQLGKDVARMEGRIKARLELPGELKPQAEGTLAADFLPEVGLPAMQRCELNLVVDQVVEAGGERAKISGRGRLETMEERALMKDAAPGAPAPGARAEDGAKAGEAARQAGKGLGMLAFSRRDEPNEHAFSILVPQDWRIVGGIVRVNPAVTDMAAQAVAAKCNMSICKDERETVAVRILPTILYADPRGMPAESSFPPGSVYNGCPVYYRTSADDFLARGVFPQLRPQAQDVRVTERKRLPDLAAGYKRRIAALPLIGGQFDFDAALVTVEYSEGGTRYRERLFTVLKYYPQIMWDNNDTLSFRAPLDQFEKWEPAARVIIYSVQFNPQWVRGEVAGQAKRAGIIIDTQQEVQRIEQEINAHRQKTNAEINNDMYLTLTGQEEYVNPYTGKVETDSGDWKYRWVTEGGQILFTDDESYDPNIDPARPFNRSDFKRSKVRPRFPGG